MPRRNVAPNDALGNPLRVGMRYSDAGAEVAPFNLKIVAIRKGYIAWRYDAAANNDGDNDNSDNWVDTVEEIAANLTPLTKKDIHHNVAELTRQIDWYVSGFDFAPASASRRAN